MDAGFLNVVENRTVFHNERHCRILTIPCSGLSWVHSAKRRRCIATRRLDPREHQNWARIGSCNLLLARQIWSWDQHHVHEQRQFSLLGQNFSWLEKVGHEFEQQRAGNLRSAVRRICVKIECEGFFKPIKGQSKTTRREPAGSSPRTVPIGKRIWTDVELGEYSISDCAESKKLIHLLRHARIQREGDGAIEFWRIKDDLQKYFLQCHHWSDDKWKKNHGKRRRKQENIPVLYWFVRSNLVLPKVIQDAVSLIPPYRTMLLFQTVSSSTFIMSDVQSIYIPSSVRDTHLEVKIWATDRQYSFCLWIPWTKTIRILIRSTWMHRVMHNTCIMHGRNIKIRCVGSTSILLWRKDWSSIKLDRTLSFFTKHSRLIAFRKLLGWKLEKSYTRKYMRHVRPPPKIPLKHDWMNELGSEVAQRPQAGQVVQQFRNSQANQPNPSPDRDRTGQPVVAGDPRTAQGRSKHVLFMKKLLNMIERRHPLFAVTQVTRKEPPKHVPLMKARTSTLETKQIMIERSNPLSAVTQATCKVTSNQCQTRLTSTSEYLDCHKLLWNKLRTLVFVNWSRRSRTPSPTCSSTRSTTKQSQQPEKYDDKENDSGRGQRRAVWTVRDGPWDAVQRMPIILEWRHRLFHRRASLERNCGQSRFHWIFIGLSLNSRVRNKQGKTSSWPQIWEKFRRERYHQAHNLKKRCIKRTFTGIHDRFWRDSDFRKSMLEHDRDEDVCLKCDDLAEQDFTDQNIFDTNKIGGSLSISLQTKDHWEHVLTSTKRCLH